MSNEKFLKLSEKLDDIAIQRTKRQDTKKAYDTDGYGYQFCVNRFNEIYGEKWGFGWVVEKTIEGNFASGKPFFDITVNCGIWIETKENTRYCVGGHISGVYADALKGAITNAFKKTAAFWGVGRHAYEGSIDDDNKPLNEDIDPTLKNNFGSANCKTEPTTPQNNESLKIASIKINYDDKSGQAAIKSLGFKFNRAIKLWTKLVSESELKSLLKIYNNMEVK